MQAMLVTTTAANRHTTKEPKFNGKKVLKLIHHLLHMVVQHCHTYDHWCTIWNFFIEKEIGIP